MNDDTTLTAETVAEPEAETTPAKAAPTPVPMIFAVSNWSSINTVGRTGRQTDARTELRGTISQVAGGGAELPAHAVIIPKEARSRLELVLAEPQARMTIPLEEYALERTIGRMKEMSAGYGMALEIGFEAVAVTGRQLIEEVEFRYTKRDA